MSPGDVVRAVLYLIYAVVSFAVASVAGAVAGTVDAVACYLVPMCRVGTSATAGLDEPDDAFAVPADSDPAVPDYLHGPARADLGYVRQLARARFEQRQRIWTRQLAEWASPVGYDEQRLAAPPTTGFGAGLLAGAAAGLLIRLLLVLLHELVVGLLALVWRAVGLALRGIDSLLLRVRSIRMRCIACFERMPYPAYLCPDCDRTHWDIRPGPLGVLRRTCRCGRRLPTLLLLGSATLTARCPFVGCGAEMHYSPGTRPELVLPIFGATGAGKTRLMYALVTALQQYGERSGVRVEFADAQTEQQLADARTHLDPDRRTAATPPALQRGLALELRVGKRERLIQLFDAAGERYYTEERSSELLYLGSARTFVLVVDPLAVDGFWLGLPAERHDELIGERPTNVPQPELVYQQTSERLLDHGGDPAHSRLAIVFSRADRLGDAGGDPDLQRWATDLGLAGLLRAARLDFREVRLFHTAAVLRDGEVDPSVRELLTWMLASAESGRSRARRRAEAT